MCMLKKCTQKKNLSPREDIPMNTRSRRQINICFQSIHIRIYVYASIHRNTITHCVNVEKKCSVPALWAVYILLLFFFSEYFFNTTTKKNHP